MARNVRHTGVPTKNGIGTQRKNGIEPGMNKDQLLNLTLTDMSFRDIYALLKRRKAVFWGTLLGCLAIATALGLFMPERYQSLSQVILEGKTQANQGNSGDIESALTQVGVEYDVPTQIRILSSFAMIYASLKRSNYPMPQQITEQVYETLPQVEVVQIGTTNAVQVSVEHGKSEYTNAVASTLPVVYKEFIEDKQRDQVKRSIEFVTARLAEEREGLRQVEQEAATFKAQNGVADSNFEQEARLGAVARAETLLNESQLALDGARASLRSVQSARSATPVVLNNPQTRKNVEAIDRENAQLAALKNQRASLLVNNFPDSDRIKRIDEAIKEQETYIGNLKETIDVSVSTRNPQLDYFDQQVEAARAGVVASEARVGSAQSVLSQKRSELAALAPIVAKQREMELRIQESQQTITRLKTLLSDTKIRDNALSSPVTDLTGATPARKVSPNLVLNLALATVAGVLLGALFSLLRDASLDRVNSVEEASILAESEVLSRIPVRSSARDPLIADPQRARAFEAYRILRSSALLAAGGDKGAFVVTSTVPKEGKTTVAGNLAVATALAGKRTVIVDANLRNPALHKLFKVDSERGLTEVVGGSLTLDDVVKETATPGLSVITAGAEVPNPTELIGSERMTQVIEDLKSRFDTVIFDSPAAFGFADTQSLVSQVKDVAYVFVAQQPTKPKMREAVGMIDFAGGRLLGLVVNKDASAARRLR